MDKSLKGKAIDIKGKKYVLVADRIIYFNEIYPQGSIQTELVKWEDKTIVIKATVSPETGRTFTGYSQAIIGDGYINKTSALENAETSAVGRALAMLGIGVIDSIASVDEINKANVSANIKNPAQVNSKPLSTILERPDQPTCKVCGEIALPSKFPKQGATHYCSNFRTCGKDTIIYPDKRNEVDKKIGAELDNIPPLEEINIDLV